MEKLISGESLSKWLKKLKQYTIYTPVKREDRWEFQPLEDPWELNGDYINTLLPAKTFIFPQREVLFKFFETPGQVMELDGTLPGESPKLLLGLRPCDGAAISRTDAIFKEDIPDPYYRARREKVVLVGLGCPSPPSPHCFCTAVGGSPISGDGLDVLMTPVKDDYFVQSFSLKGDQLLGLFSEFYRTPKQKEWTVIKKVRADASKSVMRTIEDKETLAARLDDSFETPFWREEARACIGCGICTYLCPSCHCFDIDDEVHSQSPLKGKRVRTWDNCQFPDFTMHSSGHNPRPDKASRLRRRLFHKFRYPVAGAEKKLCTGCGRCNSRCPAGIDIVDILNKVNR